MASAALCWTSKLESDESETRVSPPQFFSAEAEALNTTPQNRMHTMHH